MNDELIIEIIEMVESNMVGIMDKRQVAEELQNLLEPLNQVKNNSSISDVSGSWLDQSPFDENSEIQGILVKHNGGDSWGHVSVKTPIASFAVVSEDHDEAVKRIGSRVKVKPDKERYYCVSIIEYQ